MTLFGWIYLVLTVIGALVKINEIGKPRKPVTQIDAMVLLLVSGLMFWGLYAWGIHD